MSEEVKRKRSYRSTRRKAQAETTRAVILDAARSLFSSRGWAATTITAIAEKAEVAPETIYAQFGNKRAIVQALVAQAIRGARPQTPFMEQEEREIVRKQREPEKMIAAFAADISQILARVAPVLAVVRAAAESDEDMMELYRELHAARLRNLTEFILSLSAIGGLRQDLDEKTASDHVWSLGNPELFLVWTQVRGKSSDEYRSWLAGALKRLLLPDAMQ